MQGRTRFGLVLVAALTFAFGASAQGDKLKTSTPEERAALQTELMKSKLDLSADQLPKLSALNLKYAQKMDPILKGSGGPLVRMREARELEQAKEGELAQILSPAQFEKYQAAKEEIRQKVEAKLAEKGAKSP